MKHLPFFLLILILGSCSLEERIERREDRLMGEWLMDRATFRNRGGIFFEDITSDFRRDEVQFLSDFSLLYRTGDGEVFDGAWRITTVDAGAEEGIEFIIDAEFYDVNNELAFTWVAEIERLDRRRLKMLIQEVDGELRLRWDKVD
ncbi:MAG: hypothetical protein AAF741_16565 [Bacteroidota bacterium]